MKWLRFGLASLTLMGAGLGGIVACSDDDNGGGGTTPPPVTPPPSGNDGGTPPPPEPPPPPPNGARLLFINAATNIGPLPDIGGLRVCFQIETEQQPGVFTFPTLAPLPQTTSDGNVDGGPVGYPGLFIGTGGPIPSTNSEYETVTIRPYVIKAAKLAENGVVGTNPDVPRCAELLGTKNYDAGVYGETLVENEDYWRLADLPRGTLKNGKSYVLALTGCTADSPAGVEGACGDGDDGNPYEPTQEPGVGNLKVIALEIAREATVQATEMGVQFVHLSPAYEALREEGVAFPVTPLFGTPPLDGGAQVPIGPVDVRYDRGITTLAAPVTLTGVDTATGYFAFNAGTEGPAGPQPINDTGVNVDGGAPGLVSLARASGGTPIANGKVYTIIFLGDPNAADNAAKPFRGLHYLMFDNAFVPPPPAGN